MIHILAAGHMSAQDAHALAWAAIVVGLAAAARVVLWVFGWR